MARPNTLFHTLLFLTIFLSTQVVSQSLEDQETSVLLRLKKHWGDLPFMSQWTRSTASSRCSWPGVSCSSESNSVTELNLFEIGIVDPVPPFICDLKNLTAVDLDINSIPGEFPKVFYNCSNLETLVLSNNYFVGKLPDDIHRLSNLKTLDLGWNNFTGDLPPSIGKLKELRLLNLDMNYITGEFPKVLYNCSNLETLVLSNNYFVGKLPDDIHRLSNLKTLNLGGNNFNGDFPPSIGKLKELTFLNLGANQFNGTLAPEIGELSNLEKLDVSHLSQLSPSRLPPSFAKLGKLKTLNGFINNLIGEVPEWIGELESLQVLDISQNNLSGKIPDGLFLLKNLSICFLHKNNLSGEIPQVIDAPNLTIIDLSYNKLSGEIPRGFGNLTKLTGLALFTNKLSGTIPQGIGRLPYLVDLNLWDNNLTGELPQELGKNSDLRFLQVNNNNLSGKLPEHLCSRGNLGGVVAHDNSFTGELPGSLGTCSKMTKVDVRNNRLSGVVPSGLWTGYNLTDLVLSDNNFTGLIPQEMASNLSRLEISNNRFSGGVPKGFSKWKNMVVFKASNNLLSGVIPQEITGLPRLTTLLLDQNRLTGSLPTDVESWQFLNTLNLSRNHLSGPIPDSFGFLPALTDLDLSSNRFSGQIPFSLGRLKLNDLNLSSNNFEGKVPRALEIYAYADSFLNNPGLCGSNGLLKLKSCHSSPQRSDKIATPYIVLIITLSVVVLLLALSFSFYVVRCYWSKHGLDTKWKLTSFQKLNFTESNILSGLTDHNVIGSGGSGKVYRVQVNRNDEVVAVKRILNNRRLEHKLEQEFLAEVEILSSIRHANIVKLLCCVSSESSKLLVYEYLENRSLDRWLNSKKIRIRQTTGLASRSVSHGVLDWPKRLRIAQGAAHGLSYMHHDCVPPVIHRDIKSSNILLDSEFNAKIADFGLARLLARQGELATMSTVAGSFGYMAPEYAHTTRVNEKIDVYSFGVVLLELATGREANEGGEHTSLAEWAWRHIQEEKPIEEALDVEVNEPNYVKEMCWVFKIGIICTGSLPSTRPTMKEVVELLLRCYRSAPYGDKFASALEYDDAQYLKNLKHGRVLGDGDDDTIAIIV